jgi:tRNA A-37 threonylcarbamoyl transferase component Bud32
LRIGSQLSRYLVLEVLGEGGMGSVYLVEHIDLKTRHAIKVLLPHLSKYPQIVQRFRNEARAAAATRSANIVAVRDFGQLEDGAWYLVMDYWDGMTLSAFLASRGPLPHGLVVRTAIDALNGLAAAHRRRIIHRDLKPDNLYLAEVDGDVRAMILDFGVCRLGEDTGVVTRTGAVIGTPRYMPPEQLRGQTIDHRVDLWSMGAIAYEMATGGWLPYDDENAPRGQILDEATLSARMARPPVDPQRRAPGVPRPFADAILTMIDPDPARRPASAAACGMLLAETLPGGRHEPSGLELLQRRAPELLERRPAARSAVAAAPRAAQNTTLGSVASQSYPPPEAPEPRPKRHRRGVIVVAAAVASLGFAVSYLALHSRSAAQRDSAKVVATEVEVRVSADTLPVAPPAPAVVRGRVTRVAVPSSVPVDAGERPPMAVPSSAPVDAGEKPGVAVPSSAPVDAGDRPPMARSSSVRADVGETRLDVQTGAKARPVPAPVSLDAGATPPRPAARVPVETGDLAIYVVPFAQVWVDDSSVSVGQTPLHLKLRVGNHRIRLANKRLGKDKVVPVTITTAKEAVIDETW